jgi:hypothetical protein
MTIKYEQEIKVDLAAEEVVALTDHQYDIIDPMRSGFVWYTPPLSATEEHVTGGQTWQISGHDMQVLTISVPPNEVIVAEVGSFMFGSPDITTDVDLTLFGKNGCSQGCGRCCGGESCVKLLLTNSSSSSGYLGLTPTFPAKIVPIKVGFLLGSHAKTIFMNHLCSLTQFYVYFDLIRLCHI